MLVYKEKKERTVLIISKSLRKKRRERIDLLMKIIYYDERMKKSSV